MTEYCGQNKAYLHLFLVTHHELCEQPYFVRRWDHEYEHCKLYPIHVYSNLSMDKQMYNTVSTMFPGQKVSLLLWWCQHLSHLFCWCTLYVGDQFSLQSMMTPRNLVSVTSTILFPSINISFMDRGTHFGVKSMKFVLSMFRESLLALTHAYILAISLLISETISFRLYPVANRFVSSAKKDWHEIFRNLR